MKKQVKKVNQKSLIFKQAHKLAKRFKGDYKACFALALKIIYRAMKQYCKIGIFNTDTLEYKKSDFFSACEYITVEEIVNVIYRDKKYVRYINGDIEIRFDF